MRYPLVCLLAISLGATDTRAQESVGLPAQPVFSMGQPPQWQPYASLSWLKARSDAGANAVAGIYRPILNPISGVLGASAEAALQRSGDATLGSLRIQARTPALGIGAGLDWQDAHGVAPILSFQTAVRRGGLVGSGTMLRLDWLPGSRRTFAVGVNVPLFQPFAGRTRPRQTSASLPARTAETIGQARVPLSDSTERALATVAQAASLIRVYTNLYSREDEQVLTTSKAGEGTFDAVMRRYDAALRRSFALAVGDTDNTHGNQIAERARRGAVEKVILPYNALFGQLKDGCRVDGLVANARTDFARWIRDSVSLSPAQQSRVNTVYGRWLDVLRGQCREILHQWQDSRLVWLPLQLALASDDYDSQEQVDSLLAGAVGHAFTDHNALRYLRTADLPLEIARSIIAARSYHVLWTHDFTGRRDTGALDEIAYTMVADAYLPALTAAVSRYDSTGTLPRYIIFLDAFYYHGRDGALWMSILENPLAATVRLKSSEATQAAHLRTRLADLRAAVTRSRRLQREAATQGGEKWLRKVVRVAVNVTLPSDFSFRSRHIIPTFPFTADNVMRDHRKLVFYDVTEAAPYVGALLIAGIGIGEHYSSTTWEDRGYEVRGPAALEARAAARQVLESNGARLDQPPSPLRATPFETTTDELLSDPTAARAFVGHALQVHNEAGFGVKNASVARAMLYSLATPGSVIIVPDPLWLSDTWAGMLAAAAARGCHVVIIAPALANAPSPEPPIIVLERDILTRLLALRHDLRTQMAASGGSLHVGVYAARASVADVRARLAEVHTGLSRAPWIRELIPFDAKTLEQLDTAIAQTEATDSAATTIARDEAPRAPQLHQKTVLVARESAIAALVRQAGWSDILAQTMRGQARRTIRLADALGGPAAAVDTTAGQAVDALFQRYEQSLTPAERKRSSFYFSVGSQNHDPRGLMSDGEATTIISGVQASTGLVDLFYLMARTTWIDSTAEMDRLVPQPRGLISRLAHVLRFAM